MRVDINHQRALVLSSFKSTKMCEHNDGCQFYYQYFYVEGYGLCAHAYTDIENHGGLCSEHSEYVNSTELQEPLPDFDYAQKILI